MTPGSGFYGGWGDRATMPEAASELPAPPSRAAGGWGAAWSDGGGRACQADGGGFTLAFHGELYNRPSLCRELGLDAGTDLPELLCALWRQGAAPALQRLDGVFVVAVRAPAGLWLYRDPSGVFNLYCHVGGGPGSHAVRYSSHLQTLLQLPGVPRQLARRSLHEYLRFLDISAPNTWFEGIRAVESGALLHWPTDGAQTESRPAPDVVSAPANDAAAIDRLDACLQHAVRARLAGSARPAAFLSGGIDSSLLCAIGYAYRPGLVAVTVAFEGAAFDESPLAGRIAKHLGMKHEVLRFDRTQYLRALADLALHLEQPMADPATPATLLAFAHCRERYDSVLDGMGADESHGAMPPRHVRMAVGHGSRVPQPLRGALVRLMRGVPTVKRYVPLLDFEHPAETTIRWRGFSRRDIERLTGEPVSFEHTQYFRTFARFPRHAHFERYSALVDTMPCDRLNQALQITGAPVRFPFWDRTTDRYTRQLDVHHRWRPGEPKRMLRALLARHLPPSIWDQPKHSFEFPLQAFLAGDDHALVRRHLDPDFWQTTGLLGPTAVWQLAKQFIAGDSSQLFRVWALVVLGAWLQPQGRTQ